MKLHNYKVFLQLFGMIFLAYLLHKWAFFYFNIDTTDFKLGLEKLYLIFSLFAIFATLVLLRVKIKNFDQVGMAFLWVSMLKFGMAFWVAKPLLLSKEGTIFLEKNNFLIVFMLFLAIETIIAIQLVSRKQD
jgi:hypothetical protein